VRVFFQHGARALCWGGTGIFCRCGVVVQWSQPKAEMPSSRSKTSLQTFGPLTTTCCIIICIGERVLASCCPSSVPIQCGVRPRLTVSAASWGAVYHIFVSGLFMRAVHTFTWMRSDDCSDLAWCGARCGRCG
jgi:hypothetical protein